MDNLELLDTPAVADVFGVKPDTVEKWRGQNRGPDYIRVGGLIRYRASAVQQYLDSRTVAADRTAAAWKNCPRGEQADAGEEEASAAG